MTSNTILSESSGILITPESIIGIPLGDHNTIHEQVGGWFDCVVNGHFVGYVHDEGLIIGLPYNPIASLLFGCPLVGNCVVYSSLNAQGVHDGYDHRLSKDDLVRIYGLVRFTGLRISTVCETPNEVGQS